MRRPLLSTVVAATAAVALAGCSGSGGSSDQGSTSAPVTTVTSAPESVVPSQATDPASSPAAGSAAPVTVGKTVTDDVLGEKFTVDQYVRGYQPSPAAVSKYSILADREVVLVKVTVTASDKYYDSFGASSFRLVGDDGIDDSTTSILDDELAGAGYEPLEDASTGDTSAGWIAFTIDKGRDALTLRFVRVAAKTSDGQTIPRKEFDVALG